MPQPPPARPGDGVDAIDTPALVLDLEPYERNLARMAAAAAEHGVRLRPHAKTHKCAVVARHQVRLGAVGVCCQKTAEAEALVLAGVEDVLVTNEIVDPAKMRRLAALARQARVGVCADDGECVDALGRAAAAAGSVLDLYVEIDVGAGRCGVAPGPAAVELARRAGRHPGLRFMGLQAYHGRAQHLRPAAERRAAVERAAALARETVDALESAGIACPVVTGAGTGTFRLEAASGVYAEIQPGSYVFMDADYARNLDEDGAPVAEFEQSLFVLAAVMSVPGPGRAVLDAGLKAFAVDSGLPEVAEPEGVRVAGAADEHARLELGTGAGLRRGERLRLVPGHCDPTVNLHDWLVAVRGGRVEGVWPVVARGALG